MAPDLIADIALIEVSRWQREKIMPLVAIVDWSLSLKDEGPQWEVKDYTFSPKVKGPKGGWVPLYDQMYHDGCLPPHYPVPVIRLASISRCEA